VYDGRVTYSELDLVVDGLAAYRLTRLIVEDTITAPIREKIFDKYPPSEDSWSYALTCTYCASIWVGAGIVTARAVAPRAWKVAAVGLALSGVVSLIQSREERM
jgi:hypothetical protein